MTIRKIVLAVLVCVAVVCSGCGSDDQNMELEQVSESKRLTVYTSHKEDVYGPIIKEFEERTGIWVDVQAGGTSELLEEIEHLSGSGGCDIMFGGGVESYEAYKHCFEPYLCKEYDKLQSRYESEEYLWTAFTELPIVLIYNNKLVDEQEAPHSWKELLDDKWKGRIAFANPLNSGSSCTMVATMMQVLDMSEEEILERFVEILDGGILEGSGDVVSEVSAGTKLVGVTLEETAKKGISQDADVAIIYPKDGTSVLPDGCAVVKGAAHKENAELFMDFIVSRDVQMLAVDQMFRRSVRSDISQKEIPKSVKIVEFDLGWASVHREEILRKWTQLTAAAEDDL